MEELIQIQEHNGVQVIESRLIAAELGVEHRATLQIIEKYTSEIEASFGRVAFEMLPFVTAGGIQNISVAYLTEDQAIFVATLSRNSEQVVKFKARLVKSFQAARKVINQLTQPLSEAEQILAGYKLLMQNVEKLQEQNALLENTIKAQAPKVQYCMEVLESHSDITTTVIAKELGTCAKVLNLKLKAMGIQYRQNETWVLKAKYQNEGLTQSRTHTYTDALGQKRTSILTTWTEKGRMFIHNLFKMEKNAA